MFNSLQRVLQSGLYCLFFFLVFSHHEVKAQTIVVKYDTIHSCPGTIIMSVTVKNAIGITAISLKSTFNSAVCTYVPSVPVSMNTPFYVNPKFFVGSAPTIGGVGFGQLNIAWYSLNPQTFMDDTLFKFKFNTIPGVSNFIWDTAQVGDCEWIGTAIPPSFPPILPSHYKNGRIDNLGFEALVTAQPMDITICESTNGSFVVGAQYTQSFYWQVSTDGGATFTDLTNTPPYTGANTNALILTNPPLSYTGYKYRCLLKGICIDKLSAVKTLTIIPKPVVSCGPNDAICAGSFFTMVATGNNVTSKHWSHTGTGTLQITNPDSLHIKYTPSLGDIAAGQVNIVLSCSGNAPCIPVSSQMTLFIMPNPTANAGSPVSICNGDTALLVATGGMSYLWTPHQ